MCGPHELTPGWPPWYPVRRAHGRLTPCARGIRATHTTTRVASVRYTSSCGFVPPPPPALVAHRLSPLSPSARMACQSAPLPPSPPTHLASAAPRMQLVRLRARPRVLDYCLPLAPAASARARDTRDALTTTATTTTTFSTTTHTTTTPPLPWAASVSEIPKKASAAGWICIM